jgi:hypothetical protein
MGLTWWDTLLEFVGLDLVLNKEGEHVFWGSKLEFCDSLSLLDDDFCG